MQLYTWQKGIDKKTFNSKFSVVCLSLFAVCRWSLFVTCRCLLLFVVCHCLSLFYVIVFVCRSFCLSFFLFVVLFVCRCFLFVVCFVCPLSLLDVCHCLSFVIVCRLSLFVVCCCLSFVGSPGGPRRQCGPGGHGDQVCQYIWLIWSQQSFYGEKMRCHACD